MFFRVLFFVVFFSACAQHYTILKPEKNWDKDYVMASQIVERNIRENAAHKSFYEEISFFVEKKETPFLLKMRDFIEKMFALSNEMLALNQKAGLSKERLEKNYYHSSSTKEYSQKEYEDFILEKKNYDQAIALFFEKEKDYRELKKQYEGWIASYNFKKIQTKEIYENMKKMVNDSQNKMVRIQMKMAMIKKQEPQTDCSEILLDIKKLDQLISLIRERIDVFENKHNQKGYLWIGPGLKNYFSELEETHKKIQEIVSKYSV